MPKKQPNTGSRHSKIPEGWEGQGIQIPKELRSELREAAGEFGIGGVKVLGTAAMSIIMALEPEIRQTLCNYVHQKTWKSPDGLDKERVLALLVHLLSESENGEPKATGPRWVVDEPD